VGRFDIPRLGVFLWRLYSLTVGETAVVASTACPGQYTFDPTGRDIPLFAVSNRGYGTRWISPAEWQLPAPISGALLESALENPSEEQLYSAIAPDGVTLIPNALGIFTIVDGSSNLVPAGSLTADPRVDAVAFFVDPARGRIVSRAQAPGSPTLRVTYHYGFPSTIGAGSYDRRVPGTPANPAPAPEIRVSSGSQLDSALAAVAPIGTVTIEDFLTYDSVSDTGAVTPIAAVTIRSLNQKRPLIRLAAASTWTFKGGPNSEQAAALVLEGLFISGGDSTPHSADLVFKGVFDSVTISCCTFDPGTVAAPGSTPVIAADGRPLGPARLRIRGSIKSLVIDRSILGPVIVEGVGEVETLTATDSIFQSILAEPALVLPNGVANLKRCTLLGRAAVHRIEATECVLDDIVETDDAQHGCIRFCAFAVGSILPRQYESVMIAPAAPLFTSRDFGNPGYCQLSPSADKMIVPGGRGSSILTGAENGSEIGAYARELYPIKVRSLLIKYNEYMPLGLVPVLIDVS
jgi:hypothetical protein